MAPPWQPQGKCHPFEGAIVETCAPAVPGVYGLHTQRQQLFVGEAADLRAALLLHWNELGNVFLGRQPTHFSFEVCDADTRALRAQQLIAEHRPTIQALQMLTQAALPGAIAQRPSVQHGSDGGASASVAQWPQAARTGEHSAYPAAKYFSRSQLAALAALFIFTATTSGYLGVVTGQKITARRIAALAPDAARWPVPASMTAEAAPAVASGNTVSVPRADTNSDAKRIDTTRSARARTKPLPIKVVRAPSPDGDAATEMAKRAVARPPAKVPRPDVSEEKPPVTPAAAQALSTHSWSVQIASTLDEKAALQLQEKLKTQGYDAFIVVADVNSARWYRLRVGRFGAKQEAEATRQTLQSKSNIRSAFVIGN
ncbi:MAG: SPOR domain-containing protein [Candidatus Binatia bacterium]